jgi:hypothetical protein
MRIVGFVLVAAIAVPAPIVLTAAPASAAVCKTIDTVVHSAVLGNNTADRGHVTQHVLGENPPAGLSQNGKTLFANATGYAAAWRQYNLSAHGAINCPARGAVNQTMTLAQLGMKSLDAYDCEAANAQGVCTTKTLRVTESITFSFAKNANTNNQWILITCYPNALQ